MLSGFSLPQVTFRGGGWLATPRMLAEIWTALAAGKLTVVETYEFEGGAYLVLCSASASHKPLRALGPMLLGRTRKVLAAELGIGTSTLAQVLKLELMSLGLSCSPGRVPLAMVMLAHAGAGFVPPLHTFVSHCSRDGVEYTIIGTHVDSPAVRNLPAAVRTVVYLHAAGKSYADIAARRRTSTRTVANQVAFAFQRLGVSGRLDLLHEIFASLALSQGVRIPARPDRASRA